MKRSNSFDIIRFSLLHHSSEVLVYVYLELFQTDVFIVGCALTKAPPHFNVITHLLVQCGNEPRTTTITAGTPTYTCTPVNPTESRQETTLLIDSLH